MNLYLKLFLIFTKIGAFSFGGGNAILPLIRKEVVVNNHWIAPTEFVNMVAMSQVTPGPIAINGATYVGYRVAGFWGSIITQLGVIFPTFIIMLIFTKFYFKFKDNIYLNDAFSVLIPATIGLIAAAAILMSYDSFIDFKSVLIFAGVFIASYKYKCDPILLTVISAILGIILY